MRPLFFFPLQQILIKKKTKMVIINRERTDIAPFLPIIMGDSKKILSTASEIEVDNVTWSKPWDATILIREFQKKAKNPKVLKRATREEWDNPTTEVHDRLGIIEQGKTWEEEEESLFGSDTLFDEEPVTLQAGKPIFDSISSYSFPH